MEPRVYTNDRWHVIDEAPYYMISDHGAVKFKGRFNSSVNVRRTRILGRRYVNLVIKGRVKRFYVDPLVRKYFGVTS
jgi:hypothetical protein